MCLELTKDNLETLVKLIWAQDHLILVSPCTIAGRSSNLRLDSHWTVDSCQLSPQGRDHGKVMFADF